ncbi:768_t:CDS:2 [Acaulospora colombiana]|uniref:768_t:CDS:1 n=1 Tax=Acaulospora colombiana TaxID=27376 RepID=A0ACA9L9L0_9GLOM|nr:768_t:CDS:2 [Acaulospora colombiana]
MDGADRSGFKGIGLSHVMIFNTIVEMIGANTLNELNYTMSKRNKTSSSPQYVKLISSDGFEFIIQREAAVISGTIGNMLSRPGQFLESELNQIRFRDIKYELLHAVILEKVCQYMYYKLRYTNSVTEIPNFPINPTFSLELLMAADFLDC